MRCKTRITLTCFVTVAFVCLGVLTSVGTTVEKMNVAKLMEYSELILVGQVISMTDGFDGNNLPYTDITIQVSEAIKGSAGGNFVFRQFGLMAPRDMGDGTTFLGVSPDGFAHFAIDEQVMVFLHEKTSLGFQSSAGLLQGKFTIEDSQVYNDLNNADLFKGIDLDAALLTPDEQKMIDTNYGKCREAIFRGFIRKAHEQNFFNSPQPTRLPEEPDYEER